MEKHTSDQHLRGVSEAMGGFCGLHDNFLRISLREGLRRFLSRACSKLSLYDVSM